MISVFPLDAGNSTGLPGRRRKIWILLRFWERYAIVRLAWWILRSESRPAMADNKARSSKRKVFLSSNALKRRVRFKSSEPAQVCGASRRKGQSRIPINVRARVIFWLNRSLLADTRAYLWSRPKRLEHWHGFTRKKRPFGRLTIHLAEMFRTLDSYTWETVRA
jgi:hypothetical protein